MYLLCSSMVISTRCIIIIHCYICCGSTCLHLLLRIVNCFIFNSLNAEQYDHHYVHISSDMFSYLQRKMLWWLRPMTFNFITNHLTYSGGRFKNTYELLNLRALKFSYVNKIHIFQCMGKIFCVEFERYPLKFHTKYLTYTLKDMIFIQFWNFRSS